MLHLVQSNKMEVLVEECTAWLNKQHKVDVTDTSVISHFEPDTILVQSPGMAQWLKVEIANALGIAANIQFPLPSSFIWRLYQQNLTDIPDVSAFSKDNMTWKLMKLLPTLLQLEEFESIRGYLTVDSTNTAEQVRLYELCAKIADIFDQYLMYRPDWILAWENDDPSIDGLDTTTQPWQPILWRALVRISKELGESEYHRANLHYRLIEQLETQAKSSSTKGVAIFGISAMPLQQLQVIKALSASRDVIIFWLNPSQHYWADLVDERYKAIQQLARYDENLEQAVEDYLDVGHALLASWGKLGRDYQDMLLEHVDQQYDHFEESIPSSLLSHIQSGIYELETRGTQEELTPDEFLSNGKAFPKIEIDKRDKSFQIHQCHSVVRELEVLHDQLLHLFDNNPDWHPGDVIVMMPDIAVYAPFIEGVFGSAKAELHIPYAISDRNINQESPLLRSFVQLMKIHKSRLTLSEVLDICEVPAVLERFDLSAEEFTRLRHWLIDAGVRWGWDGESKLRWDLPVEEQNSWLFGIKRLMSGYAMQSDGLFLNDSSYKVIPYDEIEGQQSVALGKFYLYLQALEYISQWHAEPKTIQERCVDALNVFERFYLPTVDDEHYIIQLRQSIENLMPHQLQFSDAIEQDVFVDMLEQSLASKGVGQRFLAGKVNFCTLMPMRSIPFKVVCLLGMNDDAYPRQSVPVGFDLMRMSKPRKGDRSRRLDDRYLFLEAILSARECLYMSYLGFSLRDNTERNESILVSELVDYCLQHFAIEGELGLQTQETADSLYQHLVRTHGLQPFSEMYFLSSDDEKSDSDILSYQGHWLNVANQSQQPVSSSPFWSNTSTQTVKAGKDDSQEELDVALLLQFFQNPIKAFFKHRWHTQLSVFSDLPQQDEPFGFDALDNYVLGERLVSSSNNDWFAQLRGEGRLPIGESGKVYFEKLKHKFAELVANVEELGTEQKRVEINLTIGQRKLVGWLPVSANGQLVNWRAGKLRAGHKFLFWIQWLMLMSQKTPLNSALFVGVEETFELIPVEADVAFQLIQRYVNTYEKGLDGPLYFFPETGWEWLKTSDINKTIAKFTGNSFSSGEGQEAHIMRVCSNLNDTFELFQETTELLLKPLYEQVEKSDG
ncbi:exodeoxyribonuclease V subunit gamma [Alteromonadaceae bacterium M269]|nr:exodeoxyribonuclease V subunit gamma [Alteromonadaceae bacterium M269]